MTADERQLFRPETGFTEPQTLTQTSVASQQTANQNQQFPVQTLDFASSRSRNTSMASQQTANQNQPIPMQAIFRVQAETMGQGTENEKSYGVPRFVKKWGLI